MMPLTPKQYKVMAYLRSCEVCPSYAEISEHMGLAGRSGASRLLDEIEARGFIKRKRNRARSIELMGAPLPAPESDALIREFDRLDQWVMKMRQSSTNDDEADLWLADQTVALQTVLGLPNTFEYLAVRARAVGSACDNTADLAALDLEELSAHAHTAPGEIVRQILVCVGAHGSSLSHEDPHLGLLAEREAILDEIHPGPVPAEICDEAVSRAVEIERRIANTPASSRDGLLAKALTVIANHLGGTNADGEAKSLFDEAKAMGLVRYTV